MLELPPFDIPDDATVEILRRMPPVQRLTVGNNMWVSARRGIECMLRSDHPDWDDEQVRREVARRMLPGAA
jgi:hypothetical protein